MPREKRSASGSFVQLRVEAFMRDALSRELQLRVPLAPKKFCYDGCRYELDAYGVSDGKMVMAEIFAHVGELKSAQKAKILKDLLKFLLAERLRADGSRSGAQKILVFADEGAAKYCRGKSWGALACREFDVEVRVVRLPSELRTQVLAAQKKQDLQNSDAEDL